MTHFPSANPDLCQWPSDSLTFLSSAQQLFGLSEEFRLQQHVRLKRHVSRNGVVVLGGSNHRVSATAHHPAHPSCHDFDRDDDIMRWEFHVKVKRDIGNLRRQVDELKAKLGASSLLGGS